MFPGFGEKVFFTVLAGKIVFAVMMEKVIFAVMVEILVFAVMMEKPVLLKTCFAVLAEKLIFLQFWWESSFFSFGEKFCILVFLVLAKNFVSGFGEKTCFYGWDRKKLFSNFGGKTCFLVLLVNLFFFCGFVRKLVFGENSIFQFWRINLF